MSWIEATTPTTYPMTLDTARQHLNLSTTHDDEYLNTLIDAATHYVEKRTNTRLLTRRIELRMDGFEDERYLESSTYDSRNNIRLPLHPASSTNASYPTVQYVDTSGTTVTLGTSVWRITTNEPRQITLEHNESWPAVRVQQENVLVTYEAGYGTTQTSVPANVLHALKLLVGHWYRNREAVEVGTASAKIEFAVDSLLEDERYLYR